MKEEFRWPVYLFVLVACGVCLLAVGTSFADDAEFALEFDGMNDYFSIGETDVLFGDSGWNGEKTISVWVRPKGSGSPDTSVTDGQMIVTSDYPRLFGITRTTISGADRIWVWNSDDDSIDSIGIEYVPNEWIQITMVHSNNTLYAYKNGELIGSTPSGPTLPCGTCGLFSAGSGRPETNFYFEGEIDEVRYWDTALDQTTIQSWTYHEVNDAHPNWSNLKAYYKMSDGLGISVSDDSSHSNTGVLNGGMGDANWELSGALTEPIIIPTNTPNATGSAGWALLFDGIDDRVDFGDTGDLYGGDSWASEKTMSVWVKPTAASSPETFFTDGAFIVTNDYPRWFGITRAIFSGADRIWVWNADGVDITGIGIDFVPGEWVQITMVHSGNTLYAYKNGELIGSEPSGPTFIADGGTGDGNLYAGGSGRTSIDYHFEGEIDEIRFWDTPLDQSTIAAWTHTEIDETHPNWSDLKAYYKKSDGLGVYVSDDSANSTVGTLLGGMGDENWVPSDALMPPPFPSAKSPVAQIDVLAPDATLQWTLDVDNCGFDIHRDTTIDIPDETNLLVGDLPADQDNYSDNGILGVAPSTYFYIIVAKNCDDTSTALSNNVGIFQFELVSGI